MADQGAFARWVGNLRPNRDAILQNRMLRPFAGRLSQSNLWRLNKRSVPRGVAIGLGVGIIIPFMHMALAALLAIPTRANVMVAAAVTLVVNPLTIPPIYYAAYQIGRWELHQKPVADVANGSGIGGELSHVMFWLHQASGPIALGTLTLSLLAAVLGYFVSSVGWRWWIGSKVRQRRLRRQLAASGKLS